MKRAYLRADGSRRLGLGHITRSLALAEGLASAGHAPVFVVKAEEPAVLDRIRRAGYLVGELPAATSFSEDLRCMTLLLASCEDRPVVVTDLCNTDTLAHLEAYQDYLGGLKATGACLLTIDDLNTLPFPSDVVVNPNMGAELMPYQRVEGTTYLLGPRYFLLGREFREAALRPRQVRRQASRVAVSLGGGDPHGAVEKVLRALLQVHGARPLVVQVVLGLQDVVPPEIGRLAQQFEGQCQLMTGVESLAPLFLWCDVAVIGGGLTKYEAAATGTPAIVLSQVDHQWMVMQEFSKAGSVLHLGRAEEVGEEALASTLTHLLADYPQQCAMSQSGKAIIDGRGVERVVGALCQR
ncbi:MAG: hypothetical protein HY686_00820 [Chloroflexi bacterium]|nr:hypothetical protein [Chloroflexota bacterium]